uniref:C2H2-type domain-containing protein n=1 Tax=Mycena chlorophos TaxID=658473 RepID=A0ABQ0KVB0_MYCCL|nr:predicted protein [Mycena chlorophos]
MDDAAPSRSRRATAATTATSAGNQKCPQCEQLVPNVKYHVRLEHQKTAAVNYKDMSTGQLVRTEGVFRCPCGTHSNPDPAMIQKHTKICSGKPAIQPGLAERALDPESEAESEPEPEPDSLPRRGRRTRKQPDPEPQPEPPQPKAPAYDPGVQTYSTSDGIVAAFEDMPEYDPAAYELSPEPHTHLSHPEIPLRELSLAVNTKIGLILCLNCNKGVSPVGKQAYEHVIGHGRVAQPSFDLGKQIAAAFPVKGNPSQITPPDGRPQPVFGLEVMPKPRLFCLRCNRGYSNHNSLRKHQGADCSKRPGEEDKYFISYAQSFGFTSAVFPVDPTLLPAASKLDLFALFLSGLPPPIDYSDRPVTAPLHEQDLDAFYQRNRWYERAEGWTPSDLRALTELTKEDPVEDALREELTDYFLSVQEMIHKHNSQGLMRKIAQTTEKDTNHEFRALMSASGRTEYITEMLRVLTALMREACEPSEEPFFILSDAQTEQLVELDTLARHRIQKNASRLRTVLHTTLFSIFTQKLEHGGEDHLLLPVMSYLVARSMGPSEWDRASKIGPVVAKLMYACRTVVLYEMEQVMVKERLSTRTAYNQFREYLMEGQDSVMNFLYENARLIRTIRGGEYSEAISQINDIDGNELLFRGRRLHLHAMGDMHRGLHNDLRKLIEEKIFFGQPIPEWFEAEIDISAIEDDPRNNEAGYCFLDNPLNVFHEQCDLYAQWFLADQERAARFMNVVNGALLWKTEPTHELLSAFVEGRRILATAKIVDVGPSVRSEEMSRDLLRNVPGSTTRNVHILSRMLTIVGTQDKTSHRVLRRLFTPGAPSHRTAQMLIKFLVFFRKFETDLIRILRGNEEAERYHMFLWPAIRRNFRGEEISERLGDETEKYFPIRLQILDFRHVTTSWMRFFSAEPTSAEDEGFDLLANHSTDTSERHYGVDRATFAYAKRSTVHKIMQATILWRRVSGIDKDQRVLTLRLPKAPGADVLVPELAARLPRPADSDDDDLPTLVDAAVAKRFEGIAELLQQTMTPLVAGLFSQFSSNIPPSTTHHPSPSLLTDVMFLRDFRKYVGQPDAHWRNPKQGELVAKMYEGSGNILADLGPELGKTTLILFHIKFYEHERVTIVVLPLNGRQRDLRDRAAAVGIRVADWNPDSTLPTNDSAQLIIVSEEHAFSIIFYTFVQSLVNTRRLARMILNDAHLLVTADKYRLAMQPLIGLLAGAVQMVFFTALPDFLVPALQEITQTNQLYIIRVPTQRPNIQYTVFLHPKDRLEGVLIDYIRRRIAEYGTDELMMVFCRTTQDAQRLAKKFQLEAYTAELEPEMRGRVYTGWKSGARVMFCNAVLGSAVEDGVVDVLHYDVGWNVIHQYQEDLCAGKNGQLAYCVYFVDEDRRNEDFNISQPFGQELIVPWAKSLDQCRRLMYSSFLHSTPVTCITLPGAQACDNCRAKLDDPDYAAPKIPIVAPTIDRHPVLVASLKGPDSTAPGQSPEYF